MLYLRKLTAAIVSAAAVPVFATPFFFSTGNVDGRIATAARPEAGSKFEIESADDFITTASKTLINSASFTGLLTGGATVADINSITIEIYRVFPKDSDVNRTSGPPTFSTNQVPTRVNSPSDVAFDDRGSSGGTLTFTCDTLSASFTAGNSVQPGGIHPTPSQTTGGNGSVTGQEIQCSANFTTPFSLAADHFFFVPQVDVAGANDFLWLSAVRPIVSPGTPFAPDLQSWTRDQFLDPDWLRIGTDIVGGTTFNAAFSLQGQTVPEPASALLLVAGLGLLAMRARKQ